MATLGGEGPTEAGIYADSIGSSLAAEVLQMQGLLAQEGSAKDGGMYTFPLNDVEEDDGSHCFILNRDDTLQLIGLLNSSEVDIARRELSGLLSRLDRKAVEGITRRLFSALSRRNQEIAELENEAVSKPNVRRGGGRSTSLGSGQMPSQRSSQRLLSPREQHMGTNGYGAQQAPMMTPRQKDPRRGPVAQARSPHDGSNTVLSPRRAAAQKEGGQLQQLKRDQEMQQLQQLQQMQLQESQRKQRQSEDASPTSTRMPQVFRRLTAPSTPSTEVSRIPVAHLGSSRAPVSMGGALVEGTQTQATSAYLEALLEAHHDNQARQLMEEDMHARQQPSPRMSEEQAKVVFDRLYKSGKAFRVRRRVYSELGLLVEQAKESEMCTFEPHLPLARRRQDYLPSSINERLYQDSFLRRKKREEMTQKAPVPSFRPQTSRSSLPTLRRGEPGAGGLSPRDTLARETLGEEGMLVADVAFHRRDEPTHERLFREHQERKERQARREEEKAEWRKHTFKPDISSSQATCPMGRSMSTSLIDFRGHGDEAGGPLEMHLQDQLYQDEDYSEDMQDGQEEQALEEGLDGMDFVPAEIMNMPDGEASSYKLHPAAAPHPQGWEGAQPVPPEEQEEQDEQYVQQLQMQMQQVPVQHVQQAPIQQMQQVVQEEQEELQEEREQNQLQVLEQQSELVQQPDGLAEQFPEADVTQEQPDESTNEALPQEGARPGQDDWSAAAHLSQVCKELRADASRPEDVEIVIPKAAAQPSPRQQTPPADQRTVGMYLNPQAQAHASPAQQQPLQAQQHQSLRRQWLQPTQGQGQVPQQQHQQVVNQLQPPPPQLKGRQASAPDTVVSPKDTMVSRQGSAATMHSTSCLTPSQSPSMSTRNFSGRLLMTHSRSPSGALSVSVPTANRIQRTVSPGGPPLSPAAPPPGAAPYAQAPMAPNPGSPPLTVRQSSSRALPTASPGSSVVFAAWPGSAGSSTVQSAAQDAQSPQQLQFQQLSPRTMAAAPPPMTVASRMGGMPSMAVGQQLSTPRYVAHPHQILQQPQLHHPGAMAGHVPWQVQGMMPNVR
eukprot:TRINITY_DN13619_c0_g1_i1.p1 TRINITY_DN13619_c0_g1~~TRINITY_DN13619_c0_g1_i1.p1  ORF type:complete len:1061 (+),score=272.69 TRINITY_DN13619_c0_g1_i1:85-3267(+)